MGETVTINMKEGASGIGTNGPDVILGTGKGDIIEGRGGNDLICGGNGNDRIYGGNGNDIIRGGDDKDRIYGGSGDDELHGGNGPDILKGDEDNDIVRGDADDDTIYGGSGNDDLAGGEGNDKIRAGSGDDIVRGGDGDDNITAEAGNDEAIGGAGDDTVRGGDGDDTLRGGDGEDDLRGGPGTDEIHLGEEPAPEPPPLPETDTSGAQFVETFDDNTGLSNLRTGLIHRDDQIIVDTSWQGDHDFACGSPATTRTIERTSPEDFIYTCRNHMMTSIGDTSGYSTGFFSPDQVFNTVTEVCWEVNLTHLGTRQWWQVAVLSVDAPDIQSHIDPANLTGLEGPDRAIALWTWKGRMRIGDERNRAFGQVAGTDKATRYPACFRDNGDGTLTMEMTGPRNGDVSNITTETFTVPGSFPAGPLKVVFQDHNYAPNKNEDGGIPIGYTWHWDNIVVR